MSHFPTPNEREAITEAAKALRSSRAYHRREIVEACEKGHKGFRVEGGLGALEREPTRTVVEELRAEGYKVEPGMDTRRGEYGDYQEYFYTVSWT